MQKAANVNRGVYETPLHPRWNFSRQHLKGTMKYHVIIDNGRAHYCGCCPDFRGRSIGRRIWRKGYKWAENFRYK